MAQKLAFYIWNNGNYIFLLEFLHISTQLKQLLQLLPLVHTKFLLVYLENLRTIVLLLEVGLSFQHYLKCLVKLESLQVLLLLIVLIIPQTVQYLALIFPLFSYLMPLFHLNIPLLVLKHLLKSLIALQLLSYLYILLEIFPHNIP